MEYAYTYGHPARLYLNPTNRCTNRCAFCVRDTGDGLGGWSLHGPEEPDLEALLAAVAARGGAAAYPEIVWCGFGEPTFRLDLITAAAAGFRRAGARIRLNTNGHACLIHRRDVLPELALAVDAVSVSLNAADPVRYIELCRPDPRTLPSGGEAAAAAPPAERFWEAMLDFLTRAPAHFGSVQASVVGAVLRAREIEECRALAARLGVARFRVR